MVGVLSLFFLISPLPAIPQEQPESGKKTEENTIFVKPGGKIKATFDGNSAELMVQAIDKAEIRFTDSEFNVIKEASLYVIKRNGAGRGSVWLEVEVPHDDGNYTDTKLEEVRVKVSSRSDSRGATVVCYETTPGSRLFRSKTAVFLTSKEKEVAP
jgi:hypothetical protein